MLRVGFVGPLSASFAEPVRTRLSAIPEVLARGEPPLNQLPPR